MRILFITDDFYPNLGANSLIVKSLGEELIQKGHSVFVMPFVYGEELAETETYNGIQIVRRVRGDGKKELTALLGHLRFGDAAKILKNRLSRKRGDRSVWLQEIVSARYEVEKLIREQRIDLAISVHCSIECSFPLYHLKKKNKLPCRWLFYMLDPFASHSYYRKTFSQNSLSDAQHKLLSACDRVLCSGIIAEEIAKLENEEITRKIEVAEYPKIQDIRLRAKPMVFDKNKKHVVYVGTFEQTVRPSDYLFRVIDLLRDSDLVFHFVGVGWQENNIFATPERTNCVFHGRLPYEEALAYECGGDFLINIGNKVTNQFPSKVLEYVCTGKPIIDVSKNRNDLTKEHFARYGNALTVYEDEVPSAVAEKIRRYTAAEHTDLLYEEIKELFKTGTPEYVAKQVEEA